MRLFALTILMVGLVGNAAQGDDAAGRFGERVAPLLRSHCASCHSGERPAANLSLGGSLDLAGLRELGETWFKVLERVESGSMPPADADPLPNAARQAIVGWVRDDLRPALINLQRTEGRSRLRRLSRVEWANTLHDLFGIRPPVLRLLPADGRVDGFDKVSAALPFSPAATEGHWQLAEDLVNRMLIYPTTRETYRLWSRGSEQSKGHLLELPENWVVSFNTDTHSGALRKANADGTPGNGYPGPRKPGRHRLRMHVYGYQTDKPLPVGIYVGHVFAYPQILKLLDVVDVPPGKPAIVEAEVYLRTGPDSDGPGSDGIRLIPLGLGVPVPKNTQASELGKGPGLAVQWVDVEELDDELPGQTLLLADLSPEMLAALRSNKTLIQAKIPREAWEASLSTSFERLGSRLFRRDPSAHEVAESVDRFLSAAESGIPLKQAWIAEVAGWMTSPDCLCLLDTPGKLSDVALASRLSYFLWNSTPDETLLAAARQGKLADPVGLRDQTERLLNDPKSQRFVDDFLDQWLGLWGIDNTTPDKDLYPEYDDELKISSLFESRATFRRLLDRNHSVRDLVAPRWGLVNERLARHYGLATVHGFTLREVAWPADSPFGGLWTQAATMKVTANGTLTSPVKRGVWVAERLLGVKIPPPPANIEPVDPDTRGAKTLREQLALHSRQGSCQACHVRFDSYGFALECFDVMGGFRTHYRIAGGEGKATWRAGLPVDASGVTPEGRAFAQVQELRQMLADRPEALAQGVARHLITYATGEPASPVDQPAIDQIVRQASAEDYGLRALVHAVVQSELFQFK